MKAFRVLKKANCQSQHKSGNRIASKASRNFAAKYQPHRSRWFLKTARQLLRLNYWSAFLDTARVIDEITRDLLTLVLSRRPGPESCTSLRLTSPLVYRLKPMGINS